LCENGVFRAYLGATEEHWAPDQANHTPFNPAAQAASAGRTRPQRDPRHRLDLRVCDEPKPEALRDHGERKSLEDVARPLTYED
jgi:hypothetical protein